MELSTESPVVRWVAAIVVLLIIAFGCYKFGNNLRPPVEEVEVVEEAIKPPLIRKTLQVKVEPVDSLKFWRDQIQVIMKDTTIAGEDKQALSAPLQQKIFEKRKKE